MRFYSLAEPPPDIAHRARWYVKVRWAVLAAVSIPGIFSIFISEGFSAQVKRDCLLGLAAFGTNALYYGLANLHRSLRYYKILAIIILFSDILVISALIFIKGGIESRSVILYTMPILMSAAIFGKRPVYNTAIVCAIIYNFIIYGDYLGWFSTLGAYNPELRLNFAYVINSSVFMTIILMCIGGMVNFINRLLVEQETYAFESIKAMKMAQSIARLGSWEWDPRSKIMKWPKELNDIFEIDVPEEQATHRDVLRCVHHDDRKVVSAALRRALTGKTVFSIEHRMVSTGGRLRYAITEGKPILGSNGKIGSVVGTTRDITDAKILDDAKTDFVSLASHQLRTPATSVKQYLGMLLEGYSGQLPANQSDLAKIAFDSNERQLSIVDDLLRVAQIDSDRLTLRFRKFDLLKMLDDVMREQQPKLTDKQQHIDIKAPTKQLSIKADRQLLRMALDNLVDNASKYSGDNTTISISITHSGGQTHIAVSDQGVGIARSDLSKLFQKFSRVDNPVSTIVGGTGLGLYLVARIANIHSGRVEVQSQLGKGTTFTIHLPDNPASS